MKTLFKPIKNPATHVFDARGKKLGRLAQEAARLLQGKHKPNYSPHLDCGDKVVIENAAAIDLPIKKLEQKKYWHYSGYPGGIKSQTLKERFARQPATVIQAAVRGMLPKNKLRKNWLKRLTVYDATARAAKTTKAAVQKHARTEK